MTSSPKENDTGENAVRPKFDFSIDHILNRAGSSESDKTVLGNSIIPLSWLQCTRYCPPKIARNQKKDGPQKRQLGRHPRIPFTTQQLSILEEKFRHTPYLSSAEVTKLSRNLQLADIRVKIWFQNRRARERRERGQLEQSEQKTHLNSTYLENRNCTETARASVPSEESVPVPSSSNASENLNIMLPMFQTCLPNTYSANFNCKQRFVNFQNSLLSDDSS